VEAPADDPAPPPSGPARWLEDAERLDVALYAAIAQTPTPALDRAMARLSRAADGSRLSLAAAAVLAATAVARHVRMPSTTSFRSGHSAAAFALATGVGDVRQPAAIPLCARQSRLD
jgi:membrane-associated phospholipid phosphatase